MVIRVRLAAAVLLALIAVPVVSHADQANGTTVAPTFGCQDGAVSISYGGGGGFSSVSLGAITNDGSVLTGLQFSCLAESEGIFYYFQHEGSGHQLVHDFSVDFGLFVGVAIPAQTLPSDRVQRACDPAVENCGPYTVPVYITDFNLYIPQPGVAPTQQDFVGVQVESIYGFSQGGNFFVDGNGNFVFDPTVPGGEATVSLFATPVPAPEPASLLLIGSGFTAGFGLLRRKHRQ